MPTPEEAETHRIAMLGRIQTWLISRHAETAYDQMRQGVFVVTEDGWGYYITVQSLAITDPMYNRLAGPVKTVES